MRLPTDEVRQGRGGAGRRAHTEPGELKDLRTDENATWLQERRERGEDRQ